MADGIIYLFDIFGTAIFAITGAVKGVRNRLDFLGVIVFAITVGCGGGMLRDVLLDLPVAVFTDEAYVIVCIIAGVAIFLLSPKIVGQWGAIQYCDALGLGVFTAIGCVKAASLGLGPVAVIASGVLEQSAVVYSGMCSAERFPWFSPPTSMHLHRYLAGFSS